MIVLDIETSGLDLVENGLLSIGAVDFLRPRDTFYGECRLRRGERIDSGAMEVNGFTQEQARDSSRQSTRDLIREFAAWLDGRSVKVIGGLHIAAFDVPFLSAKAQQTDVPLKLHRRSIDLHTLAYAKMLRLKKIVALTDGWSVMDTDIIHPFCGLPKEPKPQNALNGAKWEAESMARLIYGRGLLSQFFKYPIPSYLKARTVSKT